MILGRLKKANIVVNIYERLVSFYQRPDDIHSKLERGWGVPQSKRHRRLFEKHRIYHVRRIVDFPIVRLDLLVSRIGSQIRIFLSLSQSVEALVHILNGVAIALCNGVKATIVGTKTKTYFFLC